MVVKNSGGGDAADVPNLMLMLMPLPWPLRLPLQAKKAMASFEDTHRRLQQVLKTAEVERAALVEEQADLEAQCKNHAAEADKIKQAVVRGGGGGGAGDAGGGGTRRDDTARTHGGARSLAQRGERRAEGGWEGGMEVGALKIATCLS